MQPMKILLVSPFTSVSGSAIRFWNIASQFKQRGWSVVYTDRNAAGADPLYRTEGITYRPSPTLRSFPLDILYSTIFNLVMVLRNLDCTIVYALKPAPNNCLAALFARLLGKKVLLDIDDLDFAYLAPGLKKNLSMFFFRFFPRFFPVVTCHTRKLMTYCRQELHLPDERLLYLAQGVSGEFLKVAVAQNNVRPKSIIYVATLGITSDFDDLLPMLVGVVKAHLDVAITVVGDGVRRASFQEKAQTLGLDCITFAGRIPHAQLPDLMVKHHIGLNYMRQSFVNDCRAILKIREYLACGLQVVCNRSGDADQFADHAFVEPDLEHMERRLKQLLANPREINAGGRRFIEQQFSWETIINGLLSHLHEKKILELKNEAR
jgi:glycosyltransferase involved in cell wall biosynthesis